MFILSPLGFCCPGPLYYSPYPSYALPQYYVHSTTQETQHTNIRACSGIRNRNPSNQAASDIHSRPRCSGNRSCTSMRETMKLYKHHNVHLAIPIGQ